MPFRTIEPMGETLEYKLEARKFLLAFVCSPQLTIYLEPLKLGSVLADFSLTNIFRIWFCFFVKK